MNIPFEKLNYTFIEKPVLVGGMAMEYYGLRKSGEDVDFVAGEQDVLNLIKMYPHRVKDLYSDLGVCPYEFEIWRTINFLDYNFLKKDAIEQEDFLIVSLQNLLLMKTLAMKVEKYMQDTKLILKKINHDLYKNYKDEKNRIQSLLNQFENITIIEKKP